MDFFEKKNWPKKKLAEKKISRKKIWLKKNLAKKKIGQKKFWQKIFFGCRKYWPKKVLAMGRAMKQQEKYFVKLHMRILSISSFYCCKLFTTLQRVLSAIKNKSPTTLIHWLGRQAGKVEKKVQLRLSTNLFP